MEDIERRLSSGVSRVILGTAAVRNPGLVRDAAREFGDRVAVGVDSKNGLVAVSGWSEVSSVTVEDLCVRMRDAGVSVVIHTDIVSDGMMSGPDLESAARIIALGGLNVIVSGGAASMDDLHAARGIGAGGVIIGRALYNGAISLAEAVKIFERGRDETC
jgi:phosphoribosylformimino-5-aminoimidazole carboxamide ribotide isomerase